MIELVEATASDQYLNRDAFLEALASSHENAHILIGSAIGMAGEVGEFNEIVKKHLFQGKAFDRDHAIKELGDIYWYFAAACIALETTPEEVAFIVRNKLMAHYSETDGKFNLTQSENRKATDV